MTALPIAAALPREIDTTETALYPRLVPDATTAEIVEAPAPVPPATAIMLDAMDTLGVAIALLDREGRVRRQSGGFSAMVPEELQPSIRRWLAQSAPFIATGTRTSRLIRHGELAQLVVHAVRQEDGWMLTAAPTTSLPIDDPCVAGHYGLTPRQVEVARLLARGATDREVADELGITFSTARRHAEAVLAKLSVKRRRELCLVFGGPAGM